MSHASAVFKDNFSYAGDSLYVEASNHNRHRRATLPELQALFHPSGNGHSAPQDPVGHWYEAQLLHYGLPPSKNKAVAKTRLLDAVNKGDLQVPPGIKKLEADLKKQWTKADRDARAELKKGGGGGEAPKGKKRKAEEVSAGGVNVNITFNMGKNGEIVPVVGGGGNARTPNKRAKSTAPASKPAAISEPSPNIPRPRPIQTARKRDGNRDLGISRPGPAVKQETRVKKESSSPPPSTPRPRAKRGGWAGGSRGPTMKSGASYDSPPPPNSSPSRPSLGLINGLYVIDCPAIADGWNIQEDFTLILAIDGTHIWGSFEFGILEGILHIGGRPYRASTDNFGFTWRGRETGEGEMQFGYDCSGNIAFLGHGEIGGELRSTYGNFQFRGSRVSGEDTRPGRSARDMRNEWEQYNEDKYESERVGRWR